MQPRTTICRGFCIRFSVALVFCLVSSQHLRAIEGLQNFYDQQGDVRPLVHSRVGGELHALVVLDTLAEIRSPNLGVSSDGQNFLDVLAALFPGGKSGEHNLHLTVLQGREVSAKRIIEHLENLKSSPEDTVLFYYSGHGAWHRPLFEYVTSQTSPAGVPYDFDCGHTLTFEYTGSLLRWRIKEALNKNRPRLAIVITDCCSAHRVIDDTVEGVDSLSLSQLSPPYANVDSGSELRGKRLLKVTPEPAAVRELFFGHAGWVSVTAVPPGFTTAGGKNGGEFTNAVIANFADCHAKILEAHTERRPFRETLWRRLIGTRLKLAEKETSDANSVLARKLQLEQDSCVLSTGLLVSQVRVHDPDNITGLKNGTIVSIKSDLYRPPFSSFTFQDGHELLDIGRYNKRLSSINIDAFPVGQSNHKSLRINSGDYFAEIELSEQFGPRDPKTVKLSLTPVNSSKREYIPNTEKRLVHPSYRIWFKVPYYFKSLAIDEFHRAVGDTLKMDSSRVFDFLSESW